MSYENPWLYNGEIFDSTMIGDNVGFVYCITRIDTGKMYIGRKYFFSKRKQVGSKRKKKSESNWKEYYGSSEPLKEDIAIHGKSNFRREIISLHKTEGQVNYNETKIQFQLDVLEALDEKNERLFYNENIMSRYFSPKSLEHLYDKSEETRKRISETLKARGIKPITCQESPSTETRAKISAKLKETSHFVMNNPLRSENWTFIIKDESGIKEIPDFKNWFLKQGYSKANYIALITWSKLQNQREFSEKAKIKKKDFHPKFKMKVLGYIDPTGNKIVW